MMLARFTDLQNNNQAVYIHPSQVVAVYQVGNSTQIWTTARAANGASRIFSVAEDIDTVAVAVERASKA